jgi:hypothetical protein
VKGWQNKPVKFEGALIMGRRMSAHDHGQTGMNLMPIFFARKPVIRNEEETWRSKKHYCRQSNSSY